MDEKDPNDEELNPKGQDDINDADDSFGLPDLEYKPLDEDSDESDGAESSEPDTSEETQSEENESSEEENLPSEEVNEEATESYSFDSTEEETDTFESEEEEDEKPTLRYQVEEKSSNAPKIIGGIIAVLLISVAIWYFGFYKIQQQELAEAERVKQEQIDAKVAADAQALKAKRDAEAAAAAEEDRLVVEAEETTKAGVQILEERTGRYYIVLESFIDEDFAKDFGNKIATEGTPTFLIPPYSKKKMQRVGIGAYESVDEAQTALNELSEEFGTGKWILKY